eukprot:3194289-Amphidinium_carterae.1
MVRLSLIIVAQGVSLGGSSSCSRNKRAREGARPVRAALDVDKEELHTAMSGDVQEVSYVDLILENDVPREHGAEYENGDDDDVRQATTLSFEHWDADVLN